ncbi:hypothetical protein LTR84_011094 [Exophiala bonariae]|uniref:Uncharacterized protein n=1 Tax=Exophiala bonariae TaxID=1690606 RepID=A0AAV9NJS9_9EURO|nr:hypothetical protein LTR84_011094 [Exophiala bonariae]
MSALGRPREMSNPTASANDDLVAFQTSHSHSLPALGQQHATSSPHAVPVDDEVLEPRSGNVDRLTLKTFVFSRKGLRTDMQIVDVQNEVDWSSYYAAVKAWKFNTPDVTLHAGIDTTAEIVGVAHFRFSRHMMLGLGDPLNDPSSVVWEELRRQSLLKNRWSFEFDDSIGHNDIGTPRSEGTRRRRLLWQRTTDAADGVEGLSRMSIQNFRLTDQGTGDVVAVFIASNLTSLKKKGELRIFRELSISLERIILLSCASISEKLARD